MIKALALTTMIMLGTPCDDHFLQVLRDHGITYVSPEWAIWDAHQVCVNVQNGMAPEQVAQVVEQESGMDGWHSEAFVGAAMATYCPVNKDDRSEIVP